MRRFWPEAWRFPRTQGHQEPESDRKADPPCCRPC
jgi:hypothetical protein